MFIIWGKKENYEEWEEDIVAELKNISDIIPAIFTMEIHRPLKISV